MSAGKAETKTDGQTDRQTDKPFCQHPSFALVLFYPLPLSPSPCIPGLQRSGSPPLHELNKRHRQWVGRGFSTVLCKGAAREWICCVLRRRIPNLMPLLIGVAELVPRVLVRWGKKTNKRSGPDGRCLAPIATRVTPVRKMPSVTATLLHPSETL